MVSRRSVYWLVLAVTVYFAGTRPLFADSDHDGNRGNNSSSYLQKIAPDLRNLPPNQKVEVIIQYRNVPEQRHFDRIERGGGENHGHFDFIKGGAHTIRARRLKELAQDDDVVYISSDHPLKRTLDYVNKAV